MTIYTIKLDISRSQLIRDALSRIARQYEKVLTVLILQGIDLRVFSAKLGEA